LPIPFKLNFFVLSRDHWPEYPTKQEIILPKALATVADEFVAFYNEETKTRQLTFCHPLSTVVISARFKKGEKELGMSLFQALCLLAFEKDDKVTFGSLVRRTGMDEATLLKVLQSLVVNRHPTVLLESVRTLLPLFSLSLTIYIYFCLIF
jgi:hypothetical protein